MVTAVEKRAAAGASLVDEFEAEGFVVLRSWLSAASVDALRRDLASARRTLGVSDGVLEARDLNVDAIGLAFGDRLEATSPARREAWAYAHARRAATGGGGRARGPEPPERRGSGGDDRRAFGGSGFGNPKPWPPPRSEAAAAAPVWPPPRTPERKKGVADLDSLGRFSDDGRSHGAPTPAETKEAAPPETGPPAPREKSATPPPAPKTQDIFGRMASWGDD